MYSGGIGVTERFWLSLVKSKLLFQVFSVLNDGTDSVKTREPVSAERWCKVTLQKGRGSGRGWRGSCGLRVTTSVPWKGVGQTLNSKTDLPGSDYCVEMDMCSSCGKLLLLCGCVA